MDTPRRLFSGFNMSRPITAPKKIVVSASVRISDNSLHLVENHLAVNMMTISAKEVHSNLSFPQGLNYRRWTKYSNLFHLVQPPHPPKFSVHVNWGALAPMDEIIKARSHFC